MQPMFECASDGEEGFDEGFGVEGLDVLGGFADADELDGDVGGFADGDDDAAFGGAVEFGQEDAGDAGGLLELFGLAEGVLPGCGVEDEEDLVGGALDLPGDDRADLGELAHEGVLGLEAAGGVDDEVVDAAGLGGGAGVEGDGRGVAALLALDDFDGKALGPDLELLDSAGAEG